MNVVRNLFSDEDTREFIFKNEFTSIAPILHQLGFRNHRKLYKLKHRFTKENFVGKFGKNLVLACRFFKMIEDCVDPNVELTMQRRLEKNEKLREKRRLKKAKQEEEENQFFSAGGDGGGVHELFSSGSSAGKKKSQNKKQTTATADQVDESGGGESPVLSFNIGTHNSRRDPRMENQGPGSSAAAGGQSQLTAGSNLGKKGSQSQSQKRQQTTTTVRQPTQELDSQTDLFPGENWLWARNPVAVSRQKRRRDKEGKVASTGGDGEGPVMLHFQMDDQLSQNQTESTQSCVGGGQFTQTQFTDASSADLVPGLAEGKMVKPKKGPRSSVKYATREEQRRALQDLSQGPSLRITSAPASVAPGEPHASQAANRNSSSQETKLRSQSKEIGVTSRSLSQIKGIDPSDESPLFPDGPMPHEIVQEAGAGAPAPALVTLVDESATLDVTTPGENNQREERTGTTTSVDSQDSFDKMFRGDFRAGGSRTVEVNQVAAGTARRRASSRPGKGKTAPTKKSKKK